MEFFLVNFTNISLIFLFSYLLGSLSFAILVSKLRGLDDPRKYGSTNPGATNVFRSGDKLAAFFTLTGDVIKGYIAVFMVKSHFVFNFSTSEQAIFISISAISVFLGHLFPIFYKIKGGKGVATSLGIFFGLDPLIGFCSLCLWLLIFLVFKISSLSAIITAFLAPIFSYLILSSNWGTDSYYLVFSITLLSLLLLMRHSSNIYLLIKGKEK